MTLLILCAPVWFKSSRFKKMRGPLIAADKCFASNNGVGRPA
jgi:hypothetical protein